MFIPERERRVDMKKKMTLWDKLKIAVLWFVNGSGVMVDCSNCKSTRIRYKEGQQTSDGIYTSKYVCLSCGASAENVEVWRTKK